jgi:hypothetical protein
MAWKPDAFVALARSKRDYTAAAYPCRNMVWNYGAAVIPDEGQDYASRTEDGLLRCSYVPGGFSIFSRSMLQRMWDNTDLPRTNGKYSAYGYDTTMLYQVQYDNGDFLGEDTVFCKRWLAMGGEIFLNPDIQLGHWFIQEHAGSFSERKQRAGNAEAAIEDQQLLTEAAMRVIREINTNPQLSAQPMNREQRRAQRRNHNVVALPV